MAEKFEIELEDCYERFGSGNEDSPARLYRVKGFRTLVFDENGVKRLRALNKKREEETIPISDLPAGATFALGGIFEWIILDKNYQGGIFVLAKEPIEEKKFDEDNHNNWGLSTTRNYLNTDFKKYMEKQIGEGVLMVFERDLISDDGLKDYGTCRDHVSLISCDEYRRYRKYIPNKSDWWWTLTPWSTPNSSYVRYVHTDGSLDDCNAYSGRGGLAPVLVLPFDTKITERVKHD